MRLISQIVAYVLLTALTLASMVVVSRTTANVILAAGQPRSRGLLLVGDPVIQVTDYVARSQNDNVYLALELAISMQILNLGDIDIPSSGQTAYILLSGPGGSAVLTCLRNDTIVLYARRINHVSIVCHTIHDLRVFTSVFNTTYVSIEQVSRSTRLINLFIAVPRDISVLYQECTTLRNEIKCTL